MARMATVVPATGQVHWAPLRPARAICSNAGGAKHPFRINTPRIPMSRTARRSSPAPTLAKFSRPRLYNVQKRERLFALLDARRTHPIVWIAGPPGSGKSTLVASYVEARKLPGIWFQADPGDADPATFFHYLRSAAADLPGRRAKDAVALPVFTADYASDLPAFTRRFLREFFALFPPGSVLVVDNFHEPKGDAAWRFAFAEGLREIPDGMNLVVLSREPPVPEMARLVGEQRITRIEWEALRFTSEESSAMTAPAHFAPELAQAIYRASDGWAAGLVLMREHLARANGTSAGTLLPEGKEAVFAYFTGEIFGRAREDNQRVLMFAALLPSVSASDAAAVSGNPDAPLVLDYVYRRHLFTDRRRGDTEPIYQFHGLFREFLLAEGRRRLLPDERRDALDRAGGQLVARADFDAAATLYIEAQAWPALVGLTLHAGRSLLAEGREKTLADWLAALPPDVRASEPRLTLAEAYALLHTEPARAKTLLARAFENFAARRDLRRQLLTAAAAVECHYYEWADFAPLDGWIAEFERLLDPGPEFLSTADALRIRGALLIALLFRQPEHPRIAAAAQVLETLLAAPDIDTVSVNERVHAASILFNYFNWKTKGDTADALIARLEPWLADPRLSPKSRVWWQVHRAFNEQIRGRFARSQKIMKETAAFAAADGLKWVQFEIYHAEVTALASSDDVAGAVAALAKLRQVLDPARRMDVAYFRFQESGVLLLQDRAREAAVAATEAVQLARESGLPPLQIPHFLVRLGLCHLRLNEIQQALAVYREAVSLASGPDKRNFGLHETLVHAFDQLRGGNRGGATALLRALLPTCREMGYFGFNRMAPQVIAPVLALALAEDIERDYVRALIRRHKLAPPSADTADWPWPLALRALGEFAIAHDGVPLVSKGKAQKKPLELLKALIAHGGRNVDAAMLTALLWPDAEGDDAKTSFDSNLYRLRKLLAVEGAVLLAEGKLSLNAEVVWLDVWAFENALDGGAVEAALALYRGHFLALDAASPWVLPARDRLQAKLVRAVLATGEALEGKREWDRARALYERTLEVDNLAEALYRRLMVCLRESGDPAAALTTYRRCRELLSIVLNRSPSAETEAIRATL
jgi:ATP/maltotriose-dependent transcriptional regulator MalT/DNA-binding SARP family transcriptional activator